MRTTIDMPDPLLSRVKRMAVERRTTVRALVIDALERSFNERNRSFRLRDASAGAPVQNEEKVSTQTINQALDAQREPRFEP